jgi:glutathione S-transferase
LNTLEFLNNLAASTVSMMRGIAAEPAAAKPSQPLQLYEMEGCPYCRIVREALTALDIDAVIYPCPRDGLRFRPLVRETGGKEQFPFLVDPNTGVTMYESLDIVDYLYATYAGRASIPTLGLRTVHLPTSFAASLLRAGKGIRKRDAKVPAELLDLWSFEGSPFARPVRELLCELEIPYRLHNAGRTVWQDWLLPPLRERVVPDYQPTEANRKDLLARAGRVQVPYLFDANTGTGLFESVAILRYLRQTYQR